MPLLITVFNAHPRTRLRRDCIGDAVVRALSGEQILQADVGVVLVDDETLLKMNRQHLDHDYYTDVITFTIEEKPLEGEIYISVDRAREQAAEHGTGLYREILRLAIHGALHLVGYGDATTADRQRMSQLEDCYLD